MAVERTPSLPELDPSTVEAMRASFAQSIRLGRHADDVHDVLCRATREARSKGMEAERLLVAMKDVWYGLPRSTRTTIGDQEHTLLQELVSRCIQEYYSI
jgi:hydroxylamine reductase (hybrid-cluster protein)